MERGLRPRGAIGATDHVRNEAKHIPVGNPRDRLTYGPCNNGVRRTVSNDSSFRICACNRESAKGYAVS